MRKVAVLGLPTFDGDGAAAADGTAGDDFDLSAADVRAPDLADYP